MMDLEDSPLQTRARLRARIDYHALTLGVLILLFISAGIAQLAHLA